MAEVLGIRHETKAFEHRAPLTPEMVRELVEAHGLKVLVEPSATRVFTDGEYEQVSATATPDLSGANVVFGLKELPIELCQENRVYAFFSHVIKGQLAGMPLLTRLMELGCTLIDYEKIADANGRRLVYFGPYAGHAGMIDTLSALGQRLQSEGVDNPFSELGSAGTYGSLEKAKEGVRAAGAAIRANGLPRLLAPLVIGVTGYGTVASGVQEVLDALPARHVEPRDLARDPPPPLFRSNTEGSLPRDP